jgi:heme-degrading monooxygenase HmoA
MKYHLAQINIARFRIPASDPINADFMNSLDRVNAIAEAQPGFIWRLKSDGNDALDIQAFDDPNVAVNLSVWRDLEALANFVYRNADHLAIMRRRREWFDKLQVSFALRWIPAGHLPTPAEGRTRIETLAQLGPSPEAFQFRNAFAPPNSAPLKPVLEECT